MSKYDSEKPQSHDHGRFSDGRHFAPIRLPLRRRLQTLAVLWHSASIAATLSFFFFLCAIPPMWPLIIVYLVWIVFDDAPETGKLRTRKWMKSLKIWRWYAGYFPLHLHKTVSLEPKKTYIFGYHPHGILSFGAFGSFSTEATGWSEKFPGIDVSLLTLSSNFRTPLYRDYLQSMSLASVSKRSCEHLLNRSQSICIVVGGAQESLLAQPYTADLVLKKRLGFVKLAIKSGASLVPVFSFGENDLFEQVKNNPDTALYRFQQTFKKLMGFTMPLFHARGVFNYDFGFMPYRRPIHTVVGRPIHVEKNENPTEEELKKIQAMYVRELERVWEVNRDKFAPKRRRELRIVA
ncbi:diacylglycerol O-acyltransferase 1 [Saitoella coloradoensis]